MRKENEKDTTDTGAETSDMIAKAEANKKAEAEAKAKAEEKEIAKPPVDIRAQLKAAMSPNAWGEVQKILARLKPDTSHADRLKAWQQLGGYYSGKLFLELKKIVFPK